MSVSKTNTIPPASFAELINEATQLASQVSALEQEMMDNVLRTEKIVSEYSDRERRILLSSLSSVNAIFSVLPARGTQFESGSVVLRTCDYNGRRLVSLPSSKETTTTDPNPPSSLPFPVAASQSGTNLSSSSITSPVPRRRRSSILGKSFSQSLSAESGSGPRSRSNSQSFTVNSPSRRVRCVKNKDGNGAHVMGKIEFRGDYSDRVPDVYAWLEFPAQMRLPLHQLSKELTVTETGFEFDIDAPGGDVGSLHKGIVHWLAVPKLRRNTVLEAISDPLLKAKKEGKPIDVSPELDKVISKFLHSGGVEQTDSEGRTLLHIAAQVNNLFLMRQCLNKGANVHARDLNGETPFLTAVHCGSIDVANELMDAGQCSVTSVTDDDLNAMHLLGMLSVVGEAELQLAKALISRGVDMNAYDKNGDSVVSYICQHSPSATLLKMVLTAGASVRTVNDQGMTALHFAVMNNKEDFVRLLLECGADPKYAPCNDIGSAYDWAAKKNLGTMIATLAAGLPSSGEPKPSASSTPSAQNTNNPAITVVSPDNAAVEEDSEDKKPAAIRIGMLEEKKDYKVSVMEVSGPCCQSAKDDEMFCVINIGNNSFRTKTARVVQGDTAYWLTSNTSKQSPYDSVMIEVWSMSNAGILTQAGVAEISSLDSAASVQNTVNKEEKMWFTIKNESNVVGRLKVSVMEASPVSSSSELGMLTATKCLAASAILGNGAPEQKIDPFVSWELPREDWTAESTVESNGAWCINGKCLKLGYHIESTLGASTHRERLPALFDHYASSMHYSTVFVGKPHTTVYSVTGGQPIVCSVEDVPANVPRHILIRTKKDDIRVIAPPGKSDVAVVKVAVPNAIPSLPPKMKWVSSKSTAAQEELRKFERLCTVTRYKFGLMYAAPGQSQEEAIFNNLLSETSPAFNEFIEFIGTRIKLQGFTEYNGGLDTKQNDTGEESIFTKYGDGPVPLQIMFHVAPMLPFQEEDAQKVERKRHIGNDVCVLIFKESNGPDDTVEVDSFVSHFNNVFVVVSPVPPNPNDPDRKLYRVAIASKTGVRPYPPYFPPSGNVFEKTPEFREWLLQKLINAERVSMEAPDFRSVMLTRKTMLTNVIDVCKK